MTYKGWTTTTCFWWN